MLLPAWCRAGTALLSQPCLGVGIINIPAISGAGLICIELRAERIPGQMVNFSVCVCVPKNDRNILRFRGSGVVCVTLGMTLPAWPWEQALAQGSGSAFGPSWGCGGGAVPRSVQPAQINPLIQLCFISLS